MRQSGSNSMNCAVGLSHTIDAPLHRLPIFVRAGSFVFSQATVQHVGEMDGQALKISVYPAKASRTSLYQDDGRSMAYKTGAYSRRSLTQSRTTKKVELTIGKSEGAYKAPTLKIELRLFANDDAAGLAWQNVSGVKLNGKRLKRVDTFAGDASSTALTKAPENEDGFWRIEGKQLIIHCQDSVDAMNFSVAQ